MGTDRNVGMEAGISTLGIIATGGYDPGQTINNVEDQVANTETGSSWTEVNDLNTARNSLGFSAAGSAGTQTSALAFGGNPGQAVQNFWETQNLK